MIGMQFGSFLTLLIEGLIAAIVMHLIIRYRVLTGFDGFMAKWIAGWIGAWLGSPVLGHWAFQIGHIYAIPGILGAFIGAFGVTVAIKANAVVLATAPPKAASVVAPTELRKVG